MSQYFYPSEVKRYRLITLLNNIGLLSKYLLKYSVIYSTKLLTKNEKMIY